MKLRVVNAFEIIRGVAFRNILEIRFILIKFDESPCLLVVIVVIVEVVVIVVGVVIAVASCRA